MRPWALLIVDARTRYSVHQCIIGDVRISPVCLLRVAMFMAARRLNSRGHIPRSRRSRTVSDLGDTGTSFVLSSLANDGEIRRAFETTVSKTKSD